MPKSRHSLKDSTDTLMREEEVVKADLKAADELIRNATSKLLHTCPLYTNRYQSSRNPHQWHHW